LGQIESPLYLIANTIKEQRSKNRQNGGAITPIECFYSLLLQPMRLMCGSAWLRRLVVIDQRTKKSLINYDISATAAVRAAQQKQ